MQNSEAVREPALPFLFDWADKYIIRRKTVNQFTISDLIGMSTHSFAWKGSKLLKVTNSELSQQENRGGSFLTFQFFIKHLKGFCYCRWLDYWTYSSEGTWSYLQLSEQ